MPTVTGSYAGSSGAGIDYEFRVMADPGSQLKKFFVRDVSDMLVELEPQLEPCTSDWYIGKAVGVAVNRFPLRVSVTDCSDRIYNPDEFPQFGELPKFPVSPDFALPCTALECTDNGACESAQTTARRIRHETYLACNRATACRDEFRKFTIIAASASAIFIALLPLAGSLLGAGLFGAIAAAFVFAIAAVFLVLAAWATAQATKKRIELSTAENILHRQQERFQASLETVYEHCCPMCIHINTDIPCG